MKKIVLAFLLLAFLGHDALGQTIPFNGSAAVGAGAAGPNDVTATAAIGDNVVVRGDGPAKAIQGSGCTVDDSGNDSCTGSRSSGSGGTIAGGTKWFELGANGNNFRLRKVPDTLTNDLTTTLPNTLPSAGDVEVHGAVTADANTITYKPLSTRGISLTLGDPGGSALTTSAINYVTVPWTCTLVGWSLILDAADATLKVKFARVNAASTALPTVASNSINTNGVGVSTGAIVHSGTMTDFTSVAITKNDVIALAVTTANTAKYVNAVLECLQ